MGIPRDRTAYEKYIEYEFKLKRTPKEAVNLQLGPRLILRVYPTGEAALSLPSKDPGRVVMRPAEVLNLQLALMAMRPGEPLSVNAIYQALAVPPVAP